MQVSAGLVYCTVAVEHYCLHTSKGQAVQLCTCPLHTAKLEGKLSKKVQKSFRDSTSDFWHPFPGTISSTFIPVSSTQEGTGTWMPSLSMRTLKSPPSEPFRFCYCLERLSKAQLFIINCCISHCPAKLSCLLIVKCITLFSTCA